MTIVLVLLLLNDMSTLITSDKMTSSHFKIEVELIWVCIWVREF